MMKWNIMIAGLVVMAGIASCHHKTPERTEALKSDTLPVKISTITRDTVSRVFESSGYFTMDNETPLSFKTGGIVDRVLVHEGDAFQAGQVLATVKGVEVKAVSKQAEIGYKKARRDYRRAANLYRDSVATLEQMQNAQTALEVAKQQKNAADFNLRHTKIRASYNGYVLKRYLNEGQMAGPGMPVLLVSRAAENQWLFELSLSDVQWAVLQIGDSAHIITDVASNVALRGKVLRKNEGIDPQTGGFTAQLSVTDTRGLPLANGLFGKVTLFPSRELEAWSIPYSALLDGNADSGYVFITNDQKIAHKVGVHVSRLAHDQVIIDRGLADARYLIISGSAYLKDGSAIKVKE